VQLETALSLIRPAIAAGPDQLYLDLGAGSGLFTKALATLLPSGKIIAVDKDMDTMKDIPEKLGNIQIEKRVADFTTFTFDNLNVDSILMANALHFVKDKVPFLKKLKTGLGEKGVLVVVEYEMTAGNTWVPWPVNFVGLSTLIAESGFGSVKKIAATASRYQKDGMYSALATV
jgi:ubiquinone/menaquinone biosynthesis C-methylase UbiE